MSIIETKGAASSQGFGEFAKVVGGGKTYIEDVFSTYLYTGNNGLPQTITNGINLSEKGGLVWIKNRTVSEFHVLKDTVRGSVPLLSTNTTSPQIGNNYGVAYNGFLSNGFIAVGDNYNYASWTFRKASKFFDVVVYTGDGTSGRSIAHSLGSTPGMLIIKAIDNGETGSYANSWFVEHRSATYNGLLNQTYDLFLNLGISFNSTTFTVNSLSSGYANTNGVSYVAYLFGHDSSADGLVQCGSYTGNGSSTGPTVTLGWEPQYLMIKNESGTGSWQIIDNMRGMSMTGNAELQADLPAAEGSTQYVAPTATGFSVVSTSSEVNSNASTYVYMAVRRGPMRTPTTGASVFTPNNTSVSSRSSKLPTTYPVDATLTKGNPWAFNDRLRSAGQLLYTTSSGSQQSGTASAWQLDFNDGYEVNADDIGPIKPSYAFRRAPGFFDMVCYTGDGVGAKKNHNLGVVPEFMILKALSTTSNWGVACSLGNGNGITLASASGNFDLNTTGGTVQSISWNSTYPNTATQFDPTVPGGGYESFYANGVNYVAYLFATCPGVSKVGSYTGNGSSQTINCGFTAGARFILIKRTDSNGDWYVWDSARGIVAGNDPHLSLNNTTTEVTTDDSVDTDGTGFIVNQTSATNVNVASATYIYLAIA